jgi:hypothetical protein
MAKTIEKDVLFDIVTATAPAHWASYLINGDASGLDYYNTPTSNEGDKDIALADAFVKYMGGNIVDVSEDTHFSRYCDAPGVTLAGDMATYTALVYKK